VRADLEVEKTTFFSENKSNLQIGVMQHPSNFVEPLHYHPILERNASETMQFFIVIRGEVIVEFFDDKLILIDSIVLQEGDSILIHSGKHRIKVSKESKCVTVKQGPFLGYELDKIELEIQTK
jgi:hypothetical protein